MKIRLTESKLKQIVAESVKNVLTELDWRTYDSARQRAIGRASSTTNPYAKKRDEERAVAFSDASWNARSNNYGLEGFDTTSGGHNYPRMSRIKNDYETYKQRGYSDDDVETYLKSKYGKDYDMFKKYNGNYKVTNGDLRNAARRYDDEENYRKGNSEYRSGQGWVNKEDKNKPLS